MKNKSLFFVILGIILVSVVIFTLFKNSSSPVKDSKVKIAYVVPTLLNPYFVDMTTGAKQEISKHNNLELIVQAPEEVEDAIGQNQIIENLITKGVDAICVVPTNSETMIPMIKKANEAGIPVVNVDNKIDITKAKKAGVTIATYVGSDNFDGGKLAGEFMIKRLGGKGNVAILEGISGNDAAINRKKGFIKALQASPNIKVVTSQVANWNREQAFNIFQNILKANPDLNGVFACNDEMALGAYAAAKQAKIPNDKLIIIGFDAIKDAIKAVDNREIDATIAQQPNLMGATAINVVNNILMHKVVKNEYPTALKVITKQ